MKLSLSTLINSSLLAASVAVVSSTFSPANAATFTLTEFTGDDAEVNLTVDQAGNNVKFTVDVNSDNTNSTGDIRGVFFNIADESLLPFLKIAGRNVTTVEKDANNVNKAGNGNNINPEGPFDIGVEIGTPGMGKDDIQSTMFTISRSDNMFLDANLFTSVTDPATQSGPKELLFAVRLTSVGNFDSQRTGSSKVGVEKGVEPLKTASVPEPASTAALGLFVLSAFGVVKKKAY